VDESIESNEVPAELSEEELQSQIELAEEELRKAEQQKLDSFDALANAISKKFRDRSGRRSNKEQEWIKAEQLVLGHLAAGTDFGFYSDKPFGRPSSPHRPDRNIVAPKCDIALSQIISSQFSGGEKNWDALPPEFIPPDLPDIMERCEKMEKTIALQLEECDWRTEATKSMREWTILGTGVIKGPTNYGKMKKQYVRSFGEDGRPIWIPETTVQYKPYLSHASVWRTYFDDSVRTINESTDVVEAHPMSSLELQELMKNPGFFSDVIAEQLHEAPGSEPTESYANGTSVSPSGSNMYRGKYLVLEYHGPITRSELDKLEIEPSYDMPGDTYYGEVWVLNNKIIRIELENLEGCHKPPYSGVVWREDPGSPYGFGIPIILADHQQAISSAWHMILDNASASSGPQIVILQDAVEPADGSFEMQPGKIWYGKDFGQSVKDIFQQFSIENTSEAVMWVLDKAIQAAEEESGIPALLGGGLESPQVGSDNATGMAIEQSRSTTALDERSGQWDRYITTPRLRAMYDWNMQFNEDDSIKAPMELRIRPATEYRNKQKHIRDMEKLIVQAGQGSVVAEYVNIGELVRAQLSMMNLPTSSIVKSAEQVQAEQEEKAKNPPPPDPAVIKAQVDMKRLELEEQKLLLEKEKLAFELQQQQQREQWENEERLANTYARVAEAEAQVVKSQNEKEIALLTLAAKTETEAERNRITAGIALQNTVTSEFTERLKHTQKSRDQMIKMDENEIYREEMQLKREKGEGI
jgi:hypothetical protein